MYWNMSLCISFSNQSVLFFHTVYFILQTLTCQVTLTLQIYLYTHIHLHIYYLCKVDSSVQSLSHVQLFATPWIAVYQAPCSSSDPGTHSNSCLLNQWCHPTISSSHPLILLPSTFPRIRVFSNESILHIRCPKYLSFSFSINPSNEYSGLISFRVDQLDLLAVQGPSRSLLQYHSAKASILPHSVFFTVQLSHPYMTAARKLKDTYSLEEKLWST